MEEDPKHDAGNAAWRFIRRELWLGATVYLLLFVTAFVTGRGLPPGTHYHLGARGLGALTEALVVIVVITGFSIFYGLGALVVRRWVGCALRALMFFLFVGFLTFMHMEKVLVATRTSDGWVLSRRWPRRPIVVPDRVARDFRIRETGAVRAVDLEYAESRSGTARVDFEPVYNWDRKTRAVLEELAAALARSGARRLQYVDPTRP
jgi:hypothetical protein